MYECPKCKSHKMNIERCRDGKIECYDCGFILKDRGTLSVLNTYIPEEIRLLKDDIRFAVECLKVAVENTQELLSDHDERFGRDTRKNKLTAERLESEISDLKIAVEKLSK